MKLPFDRRRMHERNRLDDIDEIEQAARSTPAERFIRALDLCELCIGLARGNSTGVGPPSTTLEEKANLWTFRRIGGTT